MSDEGMVKMYALYQRGEVAKELRQKYKRFFGK